MYSGGYGSHGQLGLKSTVNQNEPQLVFSLTNKHVIQIAAGWNHSLVLTDKLDLYSTGYGSSGQLGIQELTLCYIFEIQNFTFILLLFLFPHHKYYF